MIHRTPLLLALLLPACASGLVPQGTEGLPIINGELCGPEVHPTAVAVITDAMITSDYGDFPVRAATCTGTLIAPDVVMTASHCLDPSLLTFGMGEAQELSYWVTFQPDLEYMSNQGQGDLPDFPPDAVEAVGWLANPNFDINELNNVSGPGASDDIALIFLSEALDVPPALVIDASEVDQLAVDAPVSIAGWGQQQPSAGPFDPPPPGTASIKVCGDTFINELGDAEMQIGAGEDTTRKCHGDSGGPTYMNVQTDHAESLRVIGVTSHAYDDQDCAKGGVDTRVDAHLDWLNQEMTAACDSGLRVWCDVPGLLPVSWYDATTGDDDDSVAGSGDDDASRGQGCQNGCGVQGGVGGPWAWTLGLFSLLALGRRRR